MASDPVVAAFDKFRYKLTHGLPRYDAGRLLEKKCGIRRISTGAKTEITDPIDLDTFIEGYRKNYGTLNRLFITSCEDFSDYVRLNNTLVSIADDIDAYETARKASSTPSEYVRFTFVSCPFGITQYAYIAGLRDCYDGSANGHMHESSYTPYHR